MVPSQGDTRMGLVNGAETKPQCCSQEKEGAGVEVPPPASPGWLPGSRSAARGWRIPGARSSRPRSSGTTLGTKHRVRTHMGSHCSTPSSSTEPLLENNHIICLNSAPLAGGDTKIKHQTEPAPCPALLIVGLGFTITRIQ